MLVSFCAAVQISALDNFSALLAEPEYAWTLVEYFVSKNN